MKELAEATREYREKLLTDPYRPIYHFAIPDGNGAPGDPNGAFFADGIYHLMYLYANTKIGGYHWGHISSSDLLHWRHHPDALTVENGDMGCFSGGAFVDDDKTAYLTFWKFPSADGSDNGGIAIAYAKPPYDNWERLEPIAINGSKSVWGTVDLEIDGVVEHISCADPSNIWKSNGVYYMQTGNKCVLDAYGRAEDSLCHYQGDWTDLFRSKDLKNWEFVHRFYKNPHKEDTWPDKTEDDMCPSFLPLFDAKENGKKTDKMLQLFISHNKGCQYFVGDIEEETFIPTHHGRMSWKDPAFFAPEALIDDHNRHIMWAWLLDNPSGVFERFGWSGVYSFPRVLWWEKDMLRMAPADELDDISYNSHVPQISKEDNIFSVNNGEVFRLKAVIDISNEDTAGFCLRTTKDMSTRTEIYYDKANKKLVFDSTQSGEDGWKIKEEAPLSLEEGENLCLDIFVDKSVIEVYANEKQAICRRVFPKDPKNSVWLRLIGNCASVCKLEVFDIFPTNPY